MSDNEETKNRRSKIQTTPDTIPINLPSNIVDTPRKCNNPLDFAPKTPLETFFKLPGLILFSMTFSYLLGRFNFNFIFVIILGYTIYNIFNRRVLFYTRALDAISIDSVRSKTIDSHETVEWLNHIVRRFWEASEHSISSLIYNEVNNILKDKGNISIASIRLSEITLGTRPLVIEKISHISSEPDKIILEVAANFIPTEASEEVLRYFKGDRPHWNTHIELMVDVGIASLPILVKDLTFSGAVRVEIELGKKMPFIKGISLCFLELPVIDFNLIPLNSVDLLDLPFTSSFLDSMISKQISGAMLAPNKIFIDLEEISKYSGKIIGVVFVQILNLESNSNSTTYVELDIEGKVFGKTRKLMGDEPCFNQGFFEIIYDTTVFITVALKSSETKIGRIYLRNLNKHLFSESVHLSDESGRTFLNVVSIFHPIICNYSKSQILFVNLISISELQCLGDPVNKLYSTYCCISVESKDDYNKKVHQKVESKRIFSTKNPFYNQNFTFFIFDIENSIIKVAIKNEKNDSEIGNCFINLSNLSTDEITKFRISNVESGDIGFKFKREFIKSGADDEEDSDSLSEVEIPEEPIENEKDDNKNSIAHSISEVVEVDDQRIQSTREETSVSDVSVLDESSGNNPLMGIYLKDFPPKPEILNSSLPEIEDLSLGIYNLLPPSPKFINYTKCYKFGVKSINFDGYFYLVYETHSLVLHSSVFSTALQITNETLVPISNEESIRIRLFSCNPDGNYLVSEVGFNLQTLILSNEIDGISTFEPLSIRLNRFDIAFEVESGLISEKCHGAKLTQFRFKTPNSPLNIYYDNNILFNPFINKKMTILSSSSKIMFQDESETRELINEHINLKSFSSEVHSKVLRCPFDLQSRFFMGELEVFIIKLINLSNIKKEVYVRVFLNEEKIYTTSRNSKMPSPAFNESFKIKVLQKSDSLSFAVFERNSISVDNIIYYKKIDLFNIPNGYSKHEISFKNSESKIHLIFNYKGIK